MTSDPAAAELHRVFDSVADDYDQSGVEFFRPVGRRLVKRAGLSAGEAVLDLACGRGAVLLPAAEAVGPTGHVLGIDLAESMIANLRRAVDEAGLSQVETRVGDARRPDLDPGRFDAVVSSCGAIIWINAAEDLRPYLRLLRPGGRLVISGPSFFSGVDGGVPFLPAEVADLIGPEMAALSQEFGAANPFTQPEQSWMTDRDRIRSTAREAGFSEVEVYEENLPIVVESGRQWVQWTYSHGMRAMWEQIPEPRATELAGQIAARIDALRGPDGTVTFETPIAHIRAQAPES